MSVTLQGIWTTSPKELRTILQQQGCGYDLTDNINYDRALAAQILYNGDKLKDEWVAHPQFLEVMSASSSLEEGLQSLREPFQRSLLHLHGSLYVAWSAATDIAGGDARHTAGGNVWDVIWGIVWDVVGGDAWDAAYDVAKVAARRDALDTARIASFLAVRLPGATLQTIEKAIVDVVWKVVIQKDSIIEDKISKIAVEKKIFSPSKIYEQLLKVDLSWMIPIGRCFYLYSLWELFTVAPPNDSLRDQLNKLITQAANGSCSEIFTEIPITIVGSLSPVLEGLGMEGGREALETLIGEYASRPPTREEVMQRLLTLF